jgi:putative ABC transport system substrate-binding protein
MASYIGRRKFLATLGGAAAAWPLAAYAQQPAMPVIGFLSGGSQLADASRFASFWRSLNEAGYLEGRNVAGEYRWADHQYDRLPALAADLVRRPVDVIVGIGGPTPALAAKAVTKTIPIVFVAPSDPVELGLVASLNRPGSNVTGVTSMASTVLEKQFEVLHETMPKARVIGCLVNPANSNAARDMREAREATQALGLGLRILNASTEREIDAAFATFAQQGAGAVVVTSDTLFNSRADQIVTLAAHHALPAIYGYREFAAAGGLMSYGTDLLDVYRRAAVHTGRILKGVKPADLPVVQATRIELVINLRTARALGITFPLSLLGRADELIE